MNKSAVRYTGYRGHSEAVKAIRNQRKFVDIVSVSIIQKNYTKRPSADLQEKIMDRGPIIENIYKNLQQHYKSIQFIEPNIFILSLKDKRTNKELDTQVKITVNFGDFRNIEKDKKNKQEINFQQDLEIKGYHIFSKEETKILIKKILTKNKTITPQHVRLAAPPHTQISNTTVMRALRELQAAGEIKQVDKYYFVKTLP